MREERQYLQSLLRAAETEKVARAYYAMEGVSRFATLDSLQAAALSSIKAAELTPVRDGSYGSIYRAAADINSLEMGARR